MYQVLQPLKATGVRIVATVVLRLRENTIVQIVRAYHVKAVLLQALVLHLEVQEAEVLAVARTPVREAVAPADDSYDRYY